MTRAFALLFAALMVLAGAGHAQAQECDIRDIIGAAPISGAAAADRARSRARP